MFVGLNSNQKEPNSHHPFKNPSKGMNKHLPKFVSETKRPISSMELNADTATKTDGRNSLGPTTLVALNVKSQKAPD